MPSSLIIGALGLEAGGLAAGLVTLGVRLAETYAISSLINKDQGNVPTSTSEKQGGNVQLAPATNNKLPVIYGTQFISPIIVDAMLSTDQQTMWYVLAFSETTDAGTITFGDVYWDDKLLVFPPGNPSTIESWYVPATASGAEANSRVTGVGGKIRMWFYNNGSQSETTHRCIDTSQVDQYGYFPLSQGQSNVDAISVLNDSGIPSDVRWTANNLMANTVFAILAVQYDQNHGIQNIGNIKAEIQNTLKQPGSVIKDYLLNTRYGCAIPLANINTNSLDILDTFSAQQHSLNLTSGQIVSGTRYTLNGLLNTSQDCMVNLNLLADSCDSWVQWDERTAQWGVVMNVAYNDIDPNKAEDTLFTVTKDNIIGGISILPTDLKTSANQLTIQYPNFVLDNQTDYRYYELPNQYLNINEPLNNLTVNYPFVDNDMQATWLGYKKLWSSRSDLIVNFTMDYSGIKIDAGDIIRVDHEWYGWGPSVGKPYKFFRVTQVKEAKDPSGFLSVSIAAMEYNPSIYSTTDPGFFYLTEFNYNLLTDPNIITPPGAPLVFANTATNTITVTTDLPTTGRVEGIEFWYGTTSTIGFNNFALYETQHYVTTSTVSNGATILYPHTGTESVNFINLPSGSYYFVTKALGPFSASDFSTITGPVNWTLTSTNGSPVDGATINDNSISGSKVITGDPATQGTSQSKSFFDTLGPLLIGSLGLAVATYGYKQGLFNDILPEDWIPKGGGNDAGETPVTPTVTTKTLLADGTYDENNTPKEGDTVAYIADATPDQPAPVDYADNYGFQDYGYNNWSAGDGGYSEA
jgi:hypothetical protein